MKIRGDRLLRFNRFLASGIGVLVYDKLLLIAEQMEAWIDDDRLPPRVAFARMVRDQPGLISLTTSDIADIRTALEEFWEFGDDFSAFLNERELEQNEERMQTDESEGKQGE